MLVYIVLLGGGAGKRLWPLSNELRSKLFIELLPSPAGGRESMLGRVCRQLEEANLLHAAMIVTHQDQLPLTARHTRDRIPMIGEPYKKGTFTAAAIAALYLQSNGLATSEDIICIAPADVFAGEDFFRHFHSLPGLLREAQADLALLGTRPTHPTDQYGYILPDTINEKGYAPIKRFVEKPEVRRAEQLIQQGALWNCGVYAFSLAYMLSRIEEAGLPLIYDELIARYEQLPVISFDKQVGERTPRSIVVPYEGLWQDLGSWDSFTAQLDSHVIGNGYLSGNQGDSYIINELPYPIHLIGLTGIIAAASADGILIADKKQSQEIKAQLGNLPHQPMMGELSWGSYRMIDNAAAGQDQLHVLTLCITISAGKQIGLQQHLNDCIAWTVLSGHGRFVRNGEIQEVRAGDQFNILSEGSYAIAAESELVLLVVRIGEYISQEPLWVEAENKKP